MYISHKANVLQIVNETEWQCRRKTKGLDKSDYWTWIESITSGDPPVITYPSEDFTIVECTDEDVQARLTQLGDYVNQNRGPKEALVYNIKWSNSKVNCEEILGEDGKSQSPKVYVKSHFKGDDTAKDKRLLDEEWVRIRTERTRLLAETDHLALSDQTLSGDMATYRKKLRELPSDQSSKTKYSDITWPTKP